MISEWLHLARQAHSAIEGAETFRVPYYQAGGQFKQMTAHAPLTRNVLIRHYRGEATIGAHLISPDNLCTSVAADIDAHDDAADPDRNWRRALTTAEQLAGYGLRPLVVDSNGKGGYHGLAFFKTPIPAAVAWWLGAQLRDALEAAGFPPGEFFPKQGGVTLATPYGNWIRLPGKHHKRDHWSRIYDLEAGRWLEGENAVQRLVAVAGDAPGRLLDAFRNAQAHAAATTAPGTRTAAPPPKPRRGDRKADAATVREALGFLPADWVDSYGGSRADTGWLGVGFALHDWDTGRGLDLWEEFSRRSPKYEPGACAAKWGSFTAGGGLTLGTIFHAAEANGWTPPWRRPGRTPSAHGLAGPAADAAGQEPPEPEPPRDVAELRARAVAFTTWAEVLEDRNFLTTLAALAATDRTAAATVDADLRTTFQKSYKAAHIKGALKQFGPRRGHARTETSPRPGLQEILVDRPIHEVIADAVDCLGADPEVFQRGPNLVRMIRNETPPKGLKGTEGTPQIAIIPATRLLELLSRSARWVRERMNQDGDPILVDTDPTATHAGLVKDRCDWPGIRVLERVIEAPCLRTDGTLLQTPGHDPDTGLFFLPHPGVTFPEVPEHPTIADARAAVTLLLDLVVDFPFARPQGNEAEDSPHPYAWLASLLTILCRSAIEGPCPLFLFTANTAASGKTKLCDLVALIATGRKMPRSDYTDNNEEMAKVLFAIALGGFPVVFLDNVGSGGALGGSAIDKALTSTSLNGRILGASEMRDVPFHAVLFATGNNVRLQGDIHRRLVPCRLESPDEHPEERDEDAFQLKGDLEEHTLRNRPALVAAGLTIVRAYVVAGKPKPKLIPMDFPAWARLIRNAIHWATGFDPCATRAEARADDDSAHELAHLMTQWQVVCAGEG
ncbi:MAG: PriCT-2 domain-containing protein, partial [Isosphaeraceae bacterium]